MFYPFPKPLKINSPAPEFGRIDQHSETVYSDALISQGGFLLYFYLAPWAKSSKKDLLALKELQPELSKQNIQVVAMNPYDWQIQHALATELDLPFSLLYDPISKTAKRYGAVWVNTFFYHPLTYIVGPNGLIKHYFKGNIRPEQILSAIKTMAVLQPH